MATPTRISKSASRIIIQTTSVFCAPERQPNTDFIRSPGHRIAQSPVNRIQTEEERQNAKKVVSCAKRRSLKSHSSISSGFCLHVVKCQIRVEITDKLMYRWMNLAGLPLSAARNAYLQIQRFGCRESRRLGQALLLDRCT